MRRPLKKEYVYKNIFDIQHDQLSAKHIILNKFV
jgi:hypothetical protein